MGHILSATGIRPLSSKTHAIQHMNPPMTPKQVRAFLGLVGYYRKFIKGFAKVAKPLTLLTRQQVKFEWTPEHQTAFEHHCPGTYFTLPKSQQNLYCVYQFF